MTSMGIIVQLCALRRYIALAKWHSAYLAAHKLDALLSQIARPA